MSRIGKKQIAIPSDIQVKVEGQNVHIKGSKGELHLTVHPDIEVVYANQMLQAIPKEKEYVAKSVRALWGTTRQLLENMVQGVRVGYTKKLEIEGVGYKANVEGNVLLVTVGFTNPIKLEIPAGVNVAVEKNIIVISGREKGAIGQFAACVKRIKPVEPYKGKGIRYQGEYVRRKLGKRAAATTVGPGVK